MCTSTWPLILRSLRSVMQLQIIWDMAHGVVSTHKLVIVSEGFKILLLYLLFFFHCAQGFYADSFKKNKKHFYAQMFCPFSNIPPAWCVLSHLLRQVWFGNTSQRRWMWTQEEFCFSFATRGPWTHFFCGFFHFILVALPYSAVVAALCTEYHFLKEQCYLLVMRTVINHVVIWLLMGTF